MWKELPNSWRGFFSGVVLGTLILVLLPVFWLSPWALPCGAGSIVVFAIFGMVLGRALDSRDSIDDLIR
jgi:hypothetical protein